MPATTHKSPKIDLLLADIADDGLYARHYLGYFACFNRQLYYEAHDVLEELWLPIRGTPQARFYQGLIQMAGGFVHLQKNRHRELQPRPAGSSRWRWRTSRLSRASRGHRSRSGARPLPRATAGRSSTQAKRSIPGRRIKRRSWHCRQRKSGSRSTPCDGATVDDRRYN